MELCTFGMLALDDFTFSDSQVPLIGTRELFGILGGAGTYAVLGARLFREGKGANRIGWIVHVGSDFPERVREEIEGWGCNTKFIETPDRLTSRARNIYNENENREFSFLTPKIRIDETMLDEEQLESKVFHMICAPERCINLVKGLLSRRRRGLHADRSDQESIAYMDKPLFIWEPMEGSLRHDRLGAFLDAMKYVDVFSPNEEEFAKLMGLEIGIGHLLSREDMEEKCNHLLSMGFGNKPSAVVVRLGARGAYVAQPARHKQFPAYRHNQEDKITRSSEPNVPLKSKVVDVTGGGNTFLGAYCVGLVQYPPGTTLDGFETAAIYGNVAASFAIEQIGMPKLKTDGGGRETWNGESVMDRLRKYVDQLHQLG